MKVSLVVAQGLHQGKEIPVGGAQFLIGRDPKCQLRPASQAISKQHCALFARAGKLMVKDFGSTNGTFVNGEPVRGECEVKNGDVLKVGPLEFTVKVEATAPAAKKPAPAAAADSAAPASAPPGPGAAETSPAPEGGEEELDQEQIAAILLGSGDEDSPGEVREENIPEGSTVFDLPSGASDSGVPKKKEEKKEEADTGKAAADILRRYHQRPRM